MKRTYETCRRVYGRGFSQQEAIEEASLKEKIHLKEIWKNSIAKRW